MCFNIETLLGLIVTYVSRNVLTSR